MRLDQTVALRGRPRRSTRRPERALTRRGAEASLSARFPAFAKAQVVQEWAGLIDVTPDVVPVISPVDAVPGLLVATGFSGHGFGIGPGAGRLVADLVTGRDPVVDPTPFRFSRFTRRLAGRSPWAIFDCGSPPARPGHRHKRQSAARRGTDR